MRKSIKKNGSYIGNYFIDFDFLAGSVVVVVDEPPVQANDINTSPKHKFGSNPDCDESG